MILHSRKLCPSMIPCSKLHIIELISIHSRGANSTYFSRYHQIIQSLHCLFDGRIIVKTVDNIQIQIVCAKPFQAAVNFPVDSFRRKSSGIKINFGSDNHFISCNIFPECISKIFFAGSFRISVCSIKEINSLILFL